MFEIASATVRAYGRLAFRKRPLEKIHRRCNLKPRSRLGDHWMNIAGCTPEHPREDRVKSLTRFPADYKFDKQDERYIIG